MSRLQLKPKAKDAKTQELEHLPLKHVYNFFHYNERNSTFPNACGEALLAKREFMARAEGECGNEFR